MNRSDDDLLHAYYDGAMTAAEAEAFAIRLRTEPALAEAAVRLGREEAIITEWAHAHRAAAQSTIPSRSRLAVPRKAVLVLAGAALAATLLIAVLTAVHQPPAEDYAEVEDLAGEVYLVGESGEAVEARLGLRLAAGQGLRTGGEGSFAVVVSNNTRLELGADTSIRMGPQKPAGAGRGGRKVYLEQGMVAADVLRQSETPMVLSTPHGEALLETKSSFMSVPEGTRIEPEAGPVRFRRNDGQSVAVPAGWYAVALPKNPMVPRPLPNRQSKPRLVLEEESGPVQAAAISPDGALLAVACFDGSVKLFDTMTGSLRHELKLHRQAVRCLAFSPDGSMLASASNDRKVQLSDPRTGRQLGRLQGYKGVIDSLAFSPRGDILVSGGTQGKDLPEVRVWNLATLHEVANLNHHTAGVLAVAISPDGTTLATAGRDRDIHLVDLATFTVSLTLEGHRAAVTSLAFSPDGGGLVSGGRDRTVRLWSIPAGIQRSVLPAQANPVRALAFSPDGRLLATGDVSVRLYDWNTGQERLILKGHKKLISAVVFSADGKIIATTSLDKTIRLWDLMTEEEEPGPAG